MSRGGEASGLYLAAVFPSKRRLLGLDLTFLLDYKKNGFGSVSFCGREGCRGGGRGGVDAQRKVLVSVLQWLIVISLRGCRKL